MAATEYATYGPSYSTPPGARVSFPQSPSPTFPPVVDRLVMIDEKTGRGGYALPGQRVTVNYTGRLLSTGQVFDSSEGREPFQFTLGEGSVIQGWDQGLVGMQVGGKRKLVIPAALAYGDQGAPPDIPGGATLVFDVELLNIQASR